MPITFNCGCGKTLRVPDANAGRRAKCPACGAVVNIPTPEPEPVLEVVEDPEAVAPPPAPLAPPKPYAKPKYDDDDDDDKTAYGLAQPESTDHDRDRASQPRKKDKGGLPNFRKGGENHN